jgi:hypothetical protein
MAANTEHFAQYVACISSAIMSMPAARANNCPRRRAHLLEQELSRLAERGSSAELIALLQE